MSRILIAAPPFSGHLNPLIAAARRLRDENHQICFVTGPNRIAVLRKLGFEATPALAARPNAMEDVVNTPIKVGSHPIRILKQAAAMFALLGPLASEARAEIARFRPDVVLADFAAVPAAMAAQEAGVPWITSVPTPFAIETSRGTPCYLHGLKPPTSALGRARDAIVRAGTRAAKISAGKLFASDLAELGLAGMYRPDGSEAAYSPDAILGLGVRELEFDRDWPRQFEFIGPITESPEPDEKVPSFLDVKRPRILVSVGTHLDWAKYVLVGDVVKLAERFSTYEFVISQGHPAGERGFDRVLKAADNVLVVNYLPYDKFLSGFDAVIHHGGAGITYSTLRAGLPALVVPHDYDQFDFAARIEVARVGRRVPSLHHQMVRSALEEVLSGLDRSALQNIQNAIAATRPFERISEQIARLT